jgi:DNA-binding NtrC family response regulator
MSCSTILLIERSDALSAELSAQLRRSGFRVTQIANQDALPRLFERIRPDVVVLGPSTIDRGCDVNCALEIRRIAGRTPIVLVAEVSSEQLAINALRAGINEYVTVSSAKEEFTASIRRCLGNSKFEQYKTSPNTTLEGPGRMIGDSAALQTVRTRLCRVASTDSNILITGETGTGKELAAEMLYLNSRRRDKPFITINCAAIPDTLFESELFGHERGSFTGAHQSREGKLRAAHGGTVFLDEIGDMSPYGQSSMLRMMENHEIQRLGRVNGISIDVRIIAATNRNLEKLVEENSFRRDLFFRLAVTSIHLPPLRSRKEDLIALLDYYIQYFNERFGMSVQRFTDEAMAFLLAYDWPGNVRELKNLVEATFAELSPEDTLITELPASFLARCMAFTSASPSEREKLVSALLVTNWNKSKAANRLDWSRMKLYRKMAQYKIGTSRPRLQTS